MVFADLFFLFAFLPLCLIFYFIARSIKAKNIVLIVFSLIFYAWGEPFWVILLLFSAAFNWLAGLEAGKHRDQTKGKVILVTALIVNIGLLLAFKYTGFFVQTINAATGAGIPVPNIRLPIGISFFTFQAISYVIDCYRETVVPQKKFHNFLLYLSLFPQLIAGPIVRYSQIEKEITERTITPSDIYEGIVRLVAGLTKKVLLANNLWTIATNILGSNIAGQSVLGTWYGVFVYSMFIYFDFSGYSDMAIGMGRIFGFHFDENFKHPYICQSISEFWQRWHISLGSWFREYVYIPLGGNRVSAVKHARNLLIVWFLTGMWHGASWNFILWGLYCGLFIFLEKRVGKNFLKSWPVWVKHIYSKLVIIIGFGIFFFEDFSQLGAFFRNISGASAITGQASWTDIAGWNSFLNNIFLIIISVLLCMPIREKIASHFEKSRRLKVYKRYKVINMICCMVLFALCALLLVDSTNNPFLYWRF